jgi:hypothetical protein
VTFDLTFLAREGCPGSSAMLANLLAALADLGILEVPLTVDLGELAADDPRTGYGSPTVLVDGVDLFDLAAPRAAAPM